MSSEMGCRLRVQVFGESHGPGIGVVVDGFPAGEAVDTGQLARFMARRRPGGALATARREADAPEFVSGIHNGVTTGFPVCAVIRNSDARSGDYRALEHTPRPSHADYAAWVRYRGHADMRGGGHFSGRLTAPLCVAGGLALQMLARRGVRVGAHLVRVGEATDKLWPSDGLPSEQLCFAAQGGFPVCDSDAAAAMRVQIEEARACGDSVGGVVECAVVGLPAGLGVPMFDGVENRMAQALFGIPAVKGVEFGAGFAAAEMRGSACNDPFEVAGGTVRTATNNAGGALGGITSGMPVIVRCAFKPTPSIAQVQRSVNLERMQPEDIEITGRHDPCVAVRAVPVVEAAAALVALDLLLEGDDGGAR